MSLSKSTLWSASLMLALLGMTRAHAQYAPAPDAYTVIQTNAMFGPAVNMQIYRDGSRAVVEQSHDALPGGKPAHLRTLYDLENHRNYTWDLLDKSASCGGGSFSGDWGDPFAMAAEMSADLAKQQARPAGTATLNGIATKIFEADSPMGAAKVWVDQKYGLTVKLVMTPKNGEPRTLVEITQLNLAKPAASVFTLPSTCAGAANAPPALTESDKIAAMTGEGASNFANANMPPASKNSCSIVFKVVHAGSMEIIAKGFQAAIDTNVDLDHPAHYVIGESGHPMFQGGGLREITGEMRNGVWRLENAPPQFDMELAFGKGGFASSLLYRHCFATPTTLLLVVKNPDKLSDGVEWLWVKSGKFAAGAK